MDFKNRVSSVDRALDILEYLLSKNWAVSLKELSEKLNIPKATAFRIAKTLEKRGYLLNTGNNGKYILGAKIVSFTNINTEILNLKQIANSFMYELANITKQTVQLGILFEHMVMYIDQIRTEKKINVIVPTETPFPVNLSAGGKVLTAYLPINKRKDFLKYAILKKNTPKSIVNKKDFLKELNKIRKQGYAIDLEEFARGVWCVAAPIFNREKLNIASIGITGHTSELIGNYLDRMVEATVMVAKKISKALGYQK